METIDIVLVGIGGYGGFYVGSLLDNPRDDVRVVGVVDPVADRAVKYEELKATGAPFHDSLEDFLKNGSADLAVISAPIHLHAPFSKIALRNGMDVLCEKPACATIQEARQMADDARNADHFLAIGYQWSFSDAVQALKRDIVAGKFGAPKRMKTIALTPRTDQYYGRNNWAGKKRVGDDWVLDSPLNNATAHFLHNMLYLLGDSLETSVDVIDVQAELYRANPIENFDSAFVRIHTANTTDVLFYTSHAVSSQVGPVMRFEFEEANVYFDGVGSGEFVARLNNGETKRYGNPNDGGANKLWQSIDAVKAGGKRPLCDIEAATPHVLAVDGAYESTPEPGEFPEHLVQLDERPNGKLNWVQGLTNLYVQCYEAGILPAEHGGVDWAKPGKLINVEDYSSFPQC